MNLLDSQHADELAALVALHEQGSFAAAGRALLRHPSVLSKRLNALETRLGVWFVERSTRHLHLTDADRKSTRLNSSHLAISYAVLCLKEHPAPFPRDGRTPRPLRSASCSTSA